FNWAFARHLQHQIARASGHTVSIAIGPIFENPRATKESLKKTREIYALKIFNKSSCILTGAGKAPNQDIPYPAIEQKLKDIQDDLSLSRYADVIGKIRDLFTRQLVSLQDTGLLRKCMFELVRIINLQKSPQQGAPIIDPIEKLAEIQDLDNVFQMSDWFECIVGQISEESKSKHSRKIRDVLQYIHANYQKDISLNEVADRLGLSLIYTSQLFKKEVGISFVVYLARYRIERAQELLETGNYKIYEVGSMVGYQTVQYFCKTYKRITGRNPGSR
ncbi:helix-turn-helix domain-containing protein, partial [Paenibacillus sepulcri]|nr:helix-turn-helix domain-containing protein [Paenibacillus sepulcri]